MPFICAMRKDLCLSLLSTFYSGPVNIIKVICGTHNCQLIYIKSLPDYSKCSVHESIRAILLKTRNNLTVSKQYAINALGALKSCVLKSLHSPSVYD